MMGTYSQPVVPITANSGGVGGFGGGDGFLIFALLVLFGGGGFGGNRTANEVTGFQMGELSGKVATQNSVNQGFAGLSAQSASETAQLQNSTNQGFSGLNTAILTGDGQIRYDMANFAAATTAAVAEWGNKILMDNSRRAEASLQNQVTQLQINQALCGVPKVSNTFTYPAQSPFCNPCGCNSY